MAKIKLEIVGPEKVVFKGEVDSVNLPTKSGHITILPNHSQLISSLGHGVLKIIVDGKEDIYSILGGFVQVGKSSSVLVMADASEHISEIDEAKVEEAKKKAEALISEVRDDHERLAEVNAEILRAVTRLSIIQKHRSKHNIKID